MGRVIHIRLRGLDAAELGALRSRFDELAGERDWRGDRPWLADAASTDLFGQLFFDEARRHAAREQPEAGPLSAARVRRPNRAETDAPALPLILRAPREPFAAPLQLRAPHNPLTQLRHH